MTIYIKPNKECNNQNKIQPKIIKTSLGGHTMTPMDIYVHIQQTVIYSRKETKFYRATEKRIIKIFSATMDSVF